MNIFLVREGRLVTPPVTDNVLEGITRLAVIQAAKARLEERQRAADTARGRSGDDEQRPRHPDGTPKRGRLYKRAFGVPADTD